jgi:hypothetical protein
LKPGQRLRAGQPPRAPLDHPDLRRPPIRLVITPAVAELAWVARNWVRGEYPVTGTDQRLYVSEVPEREWGLFIPLNLGTYEEQLEVLERRRQMLERWHAAQQEGSNG